MESTNITFRLTRYLNTHIQKLAVSLVGVKFQIDTVEVVIADSKTITGMVTVPATTLVSDMLAANLDAEKLSNESQKIISTTKARACDAIVTLIKVLKYYLDNYRLSEVNVSNFPEWEWSIDGSNWKRCPLRLIGGSANMFESSDYTFNVSQWVSTSLNEPKYFLSAMQHLHLAIDRSNSPRSRWIDATTAAELAVKEFFARFEPKLEALMIEVPSPPLSKLYGKLLKEYAKVESPHRTAITKGVEKRNELVHRHASETISEAKVEAYVVEVELAILHLLTLLFPSDPVVQYRYSERLRRAS